MTRPEVEEMLAGRARQDHSRRPASDSAVLDEEAVADFCRGVRESSDRNVSAEDEVILRIWASPPTDTRPSRGSSRSANNRVP